MSRFVLKGFVAVVLVVGTVGGTLGCAPAEESSEEGSQNLTSDSTSAVAEKTVRAYYSATQSDDPAAALAPIVGDNAVLAAPSVKMLKGSPQVEGKDKFIKAVAGGSFLLSRAKIRDLVARGNLVIARIDLPLPNDTTITQVEYFETKNGKIERLDSYYDGIPFAAALGSIALEKLKAAF